MLRQDGGGGAWQGLRILFGVESIRTRTHHGTYTKGWPLVHQLGVLHFILEGRCEQDATASNCLQEQTPRVSGRVYQVGGGIDALIFTLSLSSP